MDIHARIPKPKPEHSEKGDIATPFAFLSMGAFLGLDATTPSLSLKLLEDHRREAVEKSPAAVSSTSAVTRSWSDVDHLTLMSTFAVTSFTYSILGQPIFLAIARQQCAKSSLTVFQVISDVLRAYGLRGLYRGAGAAATGTVLSELVYYFVVEYWKERLPLEGREWRGFGAGILADFVSTPIFNPFGVVSQVQMVAGGAITSEHNYMSAWRTTTTLVREQGLGSLFRGTLLTLAVTPLTGAWWFVYEYFKSVAYNAAPTMAEWMGSRSPDGLARRLPEAFTSTTDNLILNSLVGALSSMVLGVVMNPIYVLRLRLQVYKPAVRRRFPVVRIMEDVLKHEGVWALWKGLGANLFVGVVGGCAFGMTYEGTKKFSDNTISGREKVSGE